MPPVLPAPLVFPAPTTIGTAPTTITTPATPAMPPALPTVQRDVNPMSPPAYSPASPPPTPPPPPPPPSGPPPYSATEPPRRPLPSHAEREEAPPTYTAVDFDPRSLTQGQIDELTHKMAGPITRLLRTELRLERERIGKLRDPRR
ncbi:extensin [Streptomyces sp. RLB1-9]|uniref:extensin n=1 Tax=Streptomyces sp. RLB1-9 TaxID=2594454 RepID=UPI0011625937|nr:extensin [Streptomyces sp. RLB1-9]QDN95774.1 extensin [Streptomyces sp. RLB1-9]